MRNKLAYGIAGASIFMIALVYWPVLRADFVWDDWLDFHQMAWLREGDAWKHYIFRDFNNWTNYFRPLVVALFTIQVRLFDGAPGPMHAVSLGMHLVNTLLVGQLSWRLSIGSSEAKRTCLLAASMLLYGLHPVLIEPVAWIGCQFELIVTMLTLLGLFANLSIRKAPVRAAVLGVLFFLAACSKESAVSFPLMLIIFDWTLLSTRDDAQSGSIVHALIRRNWLAYTAMFLAGLVYLAFRHWAIGAIVNPFAGSSLSLFGRVQEISFVYLHYWKTLIWPMSGMSPIHPVAMKRFDLVSVSSLLIDAAAIGILLTGLFLALRRSSILGGIIVMVTVALLPVLHIASTSFDNSLYHERYAMTALAAACVMLSLVRWRTPVIINRPLLGQALLAMLGSFWLLFSTANIRVTLPLWANDTNLWRWALTVYPDSVEAKDSLLSAYIDKRDYANAHRLINRLLADDVPCTNCMLNAAIMAVSENDPKRAAIALEKVRNSSDLAGDERMLRMYFLTTGEMLALQGHLDDAEHLLRTAMKMAPLDPKPQVSLSMILALQGRKEEAQKIGQAGITLLPPGERSQQQKALDAAIKEGVDSAGHATHTIEE
ncbi:MAG: tetratricopeptide repeat protein [Rhodanobacter sp.]